MGCRLRYLLLLGLLGLIVLILFAQRIPRNLATNDPSPMQFSTVRAKAIADAIAREPHPVGSHQHEIIRDFIRSELKRIGLTVSEQRSTATLRMAGTEQSAVVQNILGIIPGNDMSAKAILLAAHYDSVPGGRGAGDDGAAVAALLETARALTAGPKLHRSLYFLFTDAEEVGLLGAQIFVQEHPLAHRVALALNFEARGTSGPELMYQTSANNGELIAAFARLAPYPHANSLISQLARLLPNDTDASLFVRAGYAVLAFAFVEGFENYHKATDSPQNLDLGSLAHCGSLALNLARGFGQMQQLPASASDAVYFEVFGRALVHYPLLLARLLGTLAAVAWTLLLYRELSARRVTSSGIARGVKLQVLSVVLALCVPVMLHLLRILMIDSMSLSKYSAVYGFCDLLVVTALNLLFYGSAIRQIALRELVLGGLSLCAALSLLLGWFFPTASAPWQWILVISLLVWRLGPQWPPHRESAWVALQHAPLFFAILVLTPVVSSAIAEAGPDLMPIPLVIAATVTGLFLPTLLQREFPKLYLLAGGAGAAGFALMLVVTLYAYVSHADPPSRSRVYAYDAQSNKAVLASDLVGKDAWGDKLMLNGSVVGPLRGFSLTPESWKQAAAPVVPLQAARVAWQELNATSQQRLVELRVDPLESVRCLRLWQQSGPGVSTVSINQKPVEQFVRFSPELDELGMQLYAGQRMGHVWNVRYCGPGSLVMRLRAAKAPGVRLRLVEESDSFPPFLPQGTVAAQASGQTWIGQDIELQ